ncbi:hypothetical protein L6164_025804 [Bauhinia variegata]|uniref:Uncharacterized protein n=1 Tax=Bauhinia variegata TaxID=167791 RepID=A0ACB9M216_BAUVA|nr:hypothetical protein L6164_025804 [Bauhinia variegata]
MESNPIEEEEKIEKVHSQIGLELPEPLVIKGPSESAGGPDADVKYLSDDNHGSSVPPLAVIRKTTSSGGVRVSAPINQETVDDCEASELREDVGSNGSQPLVVEDSEALKTSFDEFLMATNAKVLSEEEANAELNPRIGVKEADFDRKELGAEEKVQKVQLQIGSEVPELVILKALSESGSDPDAAVKFLNNNPGFLARPLTVIPHSATSAQPLDELSLKGKVKEEVDVGFQKQVSVKKVMSSDASLPSWSRNEMKGVKVKEECGESEVREMTFEELCKITNTKLQSVKEEKPEKKPKDHPVMILGRQRVEREHVTVAPLPAFEKQHQVKKERIENKMVNPSNVEDGDFQEEPEWFLIGRSFIDACSTTKGRKLVDNEIVYFNFPPASRYKSHCIVRISTKRSGEIGRLPMEWAKHIIPLVDSSKIKVQGRCVAAPPFLQMMQTFTVCLSFYIHRSIFSAGDNTNSFRLDACANSDSTIYPLLTLFNLLELQPCQKAEFTPEYLNSRKRLLILEGNSVEGASALPATKRRKGSQQDPEQDTDIQAISESSLNKLVGAAEVYDLKEMEPSSTLMCDLKPYQKQALYWMSELEKGTDLQNAAKTLHPCWAEYRLCDRRASSIYLNKFSGEVTTRFPAATQTASGGILADAMGLGKTVMTIALILARPYMGSSENEDADNNTEVTKKRKKDSHINTRFKPQGGTLIVCPMALLGQWKDELETHSAPESISIFVHYGCGRTDSPEMLSEHDVVLTTYGVLQAAYKHAGENSIYQRVDWYRVVLDEAHTIKAHKSQAAQAAFTLSSHCRWCLTGTPIQNSLEDLYSLLCFLHVEPWCNWAWWNKLIQKPYENGDTKALKLVKAILRPLMLRRTKDTKDKEGRPILVLPPTDIQVIECQQTEAEHDFYYALFKRSKVQFDQYVAQGKVLHNYANILELLLRLRQCCNHPFLVMSRCDTQKYADLDKLASRFLESFSDSAPVPSLAYIEEVVDGVRKGESKECPICLESPDDPVFTPCAHMMCRECLLSSLKTSTGGQCPICRKWVKKTDLITCPTENRFRVDVEKEWKESAKISKLFQCLESIKRSGSGEKSIVFSQWSSFFDLLEIPLKKEKIGYLRFDGKLSQKQRERVLKEFSETTEKRVLLMSLKAGGVGLNLTAASNVFLMDPWWNPAVEEQAIMRIHRIGQKRTVRVRRFIVKDTVEERMQQVQAKKQRMISGALTDEEVRSARIEELKMLFR